jgi:hypothetical protein
MKEQNKLKKEILKAVEKAIDKFELVDLEEEKEERIRVPENIKFEEIGGELSLISPNAKLILSALSTHGGIPCMIYAGSEINPNGNLYTDPLYLEPCKREDLKCGDIAFRANLDKPDFDILVYYCVVLNETEYALWRDSHDMDMMVSDTPWNYWYKVVK